MGKWLQVELFDWKLEDLTKENDGGILRQTLKVGGGYASPNEEALVEISVISRHASKVFDQRGLSFNLGEGLEHNIPEGVEEFLLKFKKQEQSLIINQKSFSSATFEQALINPSFKNWPNTFHLLSIQRKSMNIQ